MSRTRKAKTKAAPVAGLSSMAVLGINSRQGLRAPVKPVRRSLGGAGVTTTFTTSPPNGPSAPGSTRPNTTRCTSTRSSDPEGFWGEHGKRIDWFKPYTKVKRHLLGSRTTSRSSGTRTASPTSPTIASTATCPSAPIRPRSSGKATIPTNRSLITYAELHDEVNRFANVLHWHGVQERRPRHHLPADDP